MQAGRQGDAVDAAVKRGVQARPEGVLRRIHRELFHAVDENEPVAALAAHDVFDVALGGFGHALEIELNGRLVKGVGQILVAVNLFLAQVRAETLVGHFHHQRVGHVPDAAELFHGKRKLGGGNVDAHAAHHQRCIGAVVKGDGEIGKLVAHCVRSSDAVECS